MLAELFDPLLLSPRPNKDVKNSMLIEIDFFLTFSFFFLICEFIVCHLGPPPVVVSIRQVIQPLCDKSLRH
jgi:hypothetical protein